MTGLEILELTLGASIILTTSFAAYVVYKLYRQSKEIEHELSKLQKRN